MVTSDKVDFLWSFPNCFQRRFHIYWDFIVKYNGLWHQVINLQECDKYTDNLLVLVVAYLVCDIIVENLPKIPQRRSNSKSKTAIAFKDKQTTKRLIVQNLQEVHTKNGSRYLWNFIKRLSQFSTVKQFEWMPNN